MWGAAIFALDCKFVVEKIPLCLIGCGGMGHRHILGYKELDESGMGNIDLVAVCDLREESAKFCADEIERLFGRRPLVFTDPEEVYVHPAIEAVDVVTEPAYHHLIAVPALLAGKHVQVEKPLGLTIRSCKAIIEAAERGGGVLSTEENYRRDPVNRLVRGILDEGLLGDPHLMIQKSVGGGANYAITPWRHLKNRGTIALDSGVHYADLFQYFLGDYDRIFGTGMVVEAMRYRPRQFDHVLESYRERHKRLPESIEATGEDSIVALYRMESGAMVQFTMVTGGRGERSYERTLHGPLGSLDLPGDRNGGQVVYRQGDDQLRGREILSLLSDFRLNEITERLFGKDSVEYDLPFTAIDAKTLAIEFHDFGEAVIRGRPPEVGGQLGMTAVSGILGAFESAALNRSVSLDEILSGAVRTYQAEIDAELGLVQD